MSTTERAMRRALSAAMKANLSEAVTDRLVTLIEEAIGGARAVGDARDAAAIRKTLQVELVKMGLPMEVLLALLTA